MKISFSVEEIDEWIEFIERTCDACSDEDVLRLNKILKKFVNARSRSNASKRKIRYIQDAAWKKKNEERAEIQRDILKKYREMKVNDQGTPLS